MKKVKTPLDFSLGFTGPDVPPDKAGCPEWKNLLVTAGGALTPFPGCQRHLAHTLDYTNATYAALQGKRIILTRLAEGKLGVFVADFRYAVPRIVAFFVKGNHDPLYKKIWDVDASEYWAADVNLFLNCHAYDAAGTGSTGRPDLRRMGPHEYPSIVQLGDKVLVFDEWSVPAVVGASDVAQAGLRPPTRKPVLVASPKTYRGAVDEPADVVFSTWDTNLITVAKMDAGTAVSLPTLGTIADTFPATSVSWTSDASVLVDGATNTPGALCYRNTTNALSGGMADGNRIRMAVRGYSADSILPANSVSLVFASLAWSNGFAGTVVEVPITVPISGIDWVCLDLPWPGGLTSYACYGMKLNADTGGGRTAATNGLMFSNPLVYVPDTGPLTGLWRATMTYYDPFRGIESPFSPMSYEVDFGETGCTAMVFPQGWRGYYSMFSGITSLNRLCTPMQRSWAAPTSDLDHAEATAAPALRVYLHKPDFGADVSGQAVFYLAAEKEVDFDRLYTWDDTDDLSFFKIGDPE